jgi:hypothetical protein
MCFALTTALNAQQEIVKNAEHSSIGTKYMKNLYAATTLNATYSIFLNWTKFLIDRTRKQGIIKSKYNFLRHDRVNKFVDHMYYPVLSYNVCSDHSNTIINIQLISYTIYIQPVRRIESIEITSHAVLQ